MFTMVPWYVRTLPPIEVQLGMLKACVIFGVCVFLILIVKSAIDVFHDA